jgi:hypothetical protein
VEDEHHEEQTPNQLKYTQSEDIYKHRQERIFDDSSASHQQLPGTQSEESKGQY